MRISAGIVLCAFVLIASPQPARAEQALRIALLIANNVGDADRTPLRYAEEDARELGDVLVQLGGFRAEDVHLLRGQRLTDVSSAISAIKARVADAQARGVRTVVLFYFSGHSDGQALELGRDRWPFGDLRHDLQQLGAEIRIAIIDSCQSGALLTEKGGKPGPSFDIRFTDDLATSGEAVLTSSAAEEMALESREIRASFFSHHLVSGLRGAADASGDGKVTLGEAYRYAFVNTLLATSNTLAGPQHPGYDYRLSGQGELVLTDVLTSGAKLSLPREFDRILIADATRLHVFVELTSMSAHRVALPAGQYVVQARRGKRAYEATVALKDGESREVLPAEFATVAGTSAAVKGGEVALTTVAPASDVGVRPVLAAGVGVIRGAADAVPWVGAGTVELSWAGRRAGWSLALDVGTASASGFRESAGYLGVGYFGVVRRGPLSARAGWRLTAGSILQSLDTGQRFWTLAAGTGPWLEGRVQVLSRAALGLSAGVQGMLLERDRSAEATLWPTASLFVAVTP